jgi:mRNA interferase HigB
MRYGPRKSGHPGGDIRIITESRLTAFWSEHADAETPLKVWRRIMRAAKYQTPHEVKADFAAADFLKKGVTVSDNGGNKYRISANVRYDMQKVFIRHVMTHAEYDRRTKDGTL